MTVTFRGLGRLMLETVADPADVGRMILGLRLPSEVLWQALALVTILNAILSSLTAMASPVEGTVSPFMSVTVLGCGLVLTVFALTWAGRMLGGAGRLDEVLALVAWLQTLRVAVQAAVLVAAVVAPPLIAMIVLVAGVAFLWILVNFIDVAHRFGSRLRAAGVLLVAVVAGAIGVSILLSLVGVTALGVNGHV